MICETFYKGTFRRLRRAVCAFGPLISLTGLPANGQLIHQLSYSGSAWMDQTLDGTQAIQYTGVAAFLTMPNNQTHVYYLAGANADVHQLFYDGANWSDEDLTVVAGAPPAAPNTVVTGFSAGNYQYVYYISNETQIHQLLYNNLNWIDSNLSGLTGGPVVDSKTLVAFTTGSPAVHVYYMDFYHQHVHQIFTTNGTNWQDQDLNNLTGGTVGVGGDYAYVMGGFNIGNFQYVYFVANTEHVHQFLYNNSAWSDEDLTALTKSSPAAFSSGVSAFVIPGTQKLRVYLIDSHYHLRQLASTNNVKWSSTDLTKKTNGYEVDAETGVVAFESNSNKQLNVFYVTGNHVHQTYLQKGINQVVGRGPDGSDQRRTG